MSGAATSRVLVGRAIAFALVARAIAENSHQQLAQSTFANGADATTSPSRVVVRVGMAGGRAIVTGAVMVALITVTKNVADMVNSLVLAGCWCHYY